MVDDEGDEFTTGPGEVEIDAQVGVGDAIARGLDRGDERDQVGVLLGPVAGAGRGPGQQPVGGRLLGQVVRRAGDFEYVHGREPGGLEGSAGVGPLRVGQDLAEAMADGQRVHVGEAPVRAGQHHIGLSAAGPVRRVRDASFHVSHEGDPAVVYGEVGEPGGKFLDQGGR